MNVGCFESPSRRSESSWKALALVHGFFTWPRRRLLLLSHPKLFLSKPNSSPSFFVDACRGTRNCCFSLAFTLLYCPFPSLNFWI